MSPVIRLTRVVTSDKGTFGILSDGGTPLANTCEDPWKDNAANISCIPKGVYTCCKYSGTKYKDVWAVTDVPGRSAILIHQGNTIKDTEGCILVGNGFGSVDGLPAVINSVATLEMLKKKLPDEFILTVT